MCRSGYKASHTYDCQKCPGGGPFPSHTPPRSTLHSLDFSSSCPIRVLMIAICLVPVRHRLECDRCRHQRDLPGVSRREEVNHRDRSHKLYPVWPWALPSLERPEHVHSLCRWPRFERHRRHELVRLHCLPCGQRQPSRFHKLYRVWPREDLEQHRMEPSIRRNVSTASSGRAIPLACHACRQQGLPDFRQSLLDQRQMRSHLWRTGKRVRPGDRVGIREWVQLYML